MKTKKEVSKKSSAISKSSSKKVVAKISATKTKTKAIGAKRVAVKSKPAAVKRVSKISTLKKTKTLSASKKTIQAKRVGRGLPSFKRLVYMAFSVVLGLLLGTFVQLFLELVYMKNMMNSSVYPQIYYFMGMPSYLPGIVQGFFLLTGLVFGIWLGFWGWRFVYIEKRHRSTREA